jgi:ABC-type transport system involved in cytochrome c biogenesis permease subunit
VNGFALEVVLHWTGVALYIAALVIFANAVLFAHPSRIRAAMIVTAAGLVPHGAAIILRWIASGHGPYMLKYEVLSSNAWIAICAMVIFLFRRRAFAAVSPPTLRSIWLVFHISFAKLSAAAFLLSVATSALILLRARGRHPVWTERLPGSDILDAYTIRFVGFGFIFWTVTVAAGAIWANQSWGRYWGWDPIETWSLITWLVYGSLLHVRRFFRTGVVSTAWLTIGSFAIFILTLLILPFLIPSLHSAYFQ